MVVAATGGHRHHCVNQRNHRSTHYGVVFVLELHIQRVSFSPCIFISIHKSDAIEGRCGTESVAVILDITSFWEFAWMNYVCLMAFLYHLQLNSREELFPDDYFLWIFHTNQYPTKYLTNKCYFFVLLRNSEEKSLHLLAITAIIIMAFWEVGVVWGRVR